MNRSIYASDDDNYAGGDSGCWMATKFLGRQSHCLTLDDSKNPIPEQSCPFPDCQYSIGRCGGGYGARIKKVNQAQLV